MDHNQNTKTVVLVEKRDSLSSGDLRETNALIAAFEEQGVNVVVSGGLRAEDVANLNLPEDSDTLCVIGVEAPNRKDDSHAVVGLVNELLDRGVHFKILGDVNTLNRNVGLTVSVVNFAGESLEDLTGFVKTQGAVKLFDESKQANEQMQGYLGDVCSVMRARRPNMRGGRPYDLAAEIIWGYQIRG